MRAEPHPRGRRSNVSSPAATNGLERSGARWRIRTIQKYFRGAIRSRISSVHSTSLQGQRVSPRHRGARAPPPPPVCKRSAVCGCGLYCPPNHKNTTVPDGPRSPVRPLRHPTTRQPDIARSGHTHTSYSHTALSASSAPAAVPRRPPPAMESLVGVEGVDGEPTRLRAGGVDGELLAAE